MEEDMKCPRCGYEIKDAKFCPMCGSSMDGNIYDELKVRISNAIDEIEYNEGLTLKDFKDLQRTNPLRYWQIATKLYSNDLGCHKTQLHSNGGELSD